jgi:4-amino-4-deoxy-L-arabinose transferase-like glycosyltransferase
MMARRSQFLWLFPVAALLLGAGLGLRDPWPPDEPRFALIAKDMVESGAWLMPRVGGVLYPDKPPLFFWIVASFYVATGSIGVALLLPALLSGLGVLWLVCDLARRLWGAQAALWSGAALLATLQFPLQMKAGQIDGLLCLWTTLGLYGLCRHLLLGPDWRWYTIAGFSCGLGVLTKGVGFLPFLILIPWLYAAYREWAMPFVDWKRGKWLLAPLAFAFAVSLWLVPMLLVTSDATNPDLIQYRDDILFRQTITRYADAWGHLKPPWYLFTNAIPWLWLPLSFLLPWLVPAWSRDVREHSAGTLLLAGWILLVLLFFSLSDGKRSVYILPALPALALLAGRHLPQLLACPGPRRMLFVLTFLVAALLTAGGSYGALDPSVLQPWLEDRGIARSLSWTVAATGITCVALTVILTARQAVAGYAALSVTIWLSLSILVYPQLDAVRSGRTIMQSAAAALRASESPKEALGLAGWKEQFLLQWNRPAVHFGYRRTDGNEVYDAAAWLSQRSDRRLLLPGAMLETCFNRTQLEELGFAHRQRWFLASSPSVLPDCRVDAAQTPANVIHYDPARQPGVGGNGDAAIRSARRPRATAQQAARSPLLP